MCFTIIVLHYSSLAQPADLSIKLDEFIKQFYQYDLFNGNVLIAQKDKVVFQRSYGDANKEWQVPNNVNTKFKIGSNTKQFTAVMILQLKQEGKLDLQSKLSTHFPWFRKDIADKITMQHLLMHSSGLQNYTSSAEAINDANMNSMLPEEYAKKYFQQDLRFEPGAKFEYNNTGYFLLGMIIEQLTGKTYAQALKERILDRVGMNDSGMDDPETLIANRATGYKFDFDGYANADFINAATATYSAGGMYSTTNDLFKWEKALFGGKILSKEMLELMLTPNKGNYGYGVYVTKFKEMGSDSMKTVIGHNGGISGFSSTMLYYKDDELLVILLDNTRSGTRGNNENIAVGVRNIITGKPAPLVKQSMKVVLTKKISLLNGVQLLGAYRDMQEHKEKYDVSGASSFLNDLGYHLLLKGRRKDAIAILAYAVEQFPTESNTFDTYGEALMKDGQKEEAIKAYKRSVELNPKNENGKKMLEELIKN